MPRGIYPHYYREKAPNWKGGIKIDNLREYRKKYEILRRERVPNYRKKRLEREKLNPNFKKKLYVRVKRYREKNKEKVNFWNSIRRARRKGADGFFSFIQWKLLKEQYGYCCPVCGKYEPEITLTPDHIIPLFKGGSNYIENIQPLCRSCNCKKHINIIFYEPIRSESL